jgi:hypothetical protein
VHPEKLNKICSASCPSTLVSTIAYQFIIVAFFVTQQQQQPSDMLGQGTPSEKSTFPARLGVY